MSGEQTPLSSRRRSGHAPPDLTLAKVIMWGLIPLLGLVFSAGGGWWLLSSLDRRIELLEAQRTLDAELALPRRVNALETTLEGIDDVQRIHSGKLVAICVATGASCPEGP